MAHRVALTSRARIAVVLGSAALFALSLKLPALAFTRWQAGGPPPAGFHPAGHTTSIGLEMLAISLFGPFLLNFAILANPFLLVSWIALLKNRLRGARLAGIVATLFAMQTFQLYLQPVYPDESGSTQLRLRYPLAGWALWLAAIVLPAAFAHAYAPPREPPSDSADQSPRQTERFTVRS